MAAKKPQILRIGNLTHAQEDWKALGDIAELLEAPVDTNRDSFIEECTTGKYKDITAIYRVNSTDQTGRFDQDLVDILPKSLKFICHNGAGYDNVDPKALLGRKILFSNTPGAVDAPTADVAFFLMLASLRNLYHSSQAVRSGQWRGQVALGHDPEHKTLGILGMGGIGRALAKRAAAFDMKIIYHNRHRLSDDQEAGAEYVSLDDLLARSDVLSLNLPLNPATRHIISDAEISKCKKGVVIVNTARGPILDEAALVRGLESGQVFNAGLDVFENEPEIHPGLIDNPRVVLLPHVGTFTHESLYNLEKLVIDNLRSALTNGTLLTLIPELVAIRDVYRK